MYYAICAACLNAYFHSSIWSLIDEMEVTKEGVSKVT